METSRKTVCLILLFFCAVTLSAQEFEYKGHVTSSEGTPLENASIALLRKDQSVLQFTFTDPAGHFSVKAAEQPVSLFISHLGYETIYAPANSHRDGQTYRLKPQDIELKEVKITSQRIAERQDTLVYSVSGFRMPQDRSIADVLKKMPGIEVSPSGQIKFEDKAIAKLYIEGMDLMGEKYALATNNLSGKTVKSVQVLRNHQAIAALRGKQFSEQAAINLVLEDDAKHTLTGNIDLGGGYGNRHEGLWDLRLLGMLFGRKIQNLSLYKTNNTGVNTEDEIIPQLPSDELSIPNAAFLLTPPSATIGGIDEKYHLINRDHLAAVNHIQKLKKESTLRVQLNYLDRDDDQESKSHTTYFYPEQTIHYTDRNDLGSHLRQLNGETDYQQNTSRRFIRNILSGKWQQNHTDNALQANQQPINQTFDTDRRRITNKFHWVQPYGNGHTFKLVSLQAYEELLQQLTVTPFPYPGQTTDSTAYATLRQDVRLYNFHSTNRLELQAKVFGFYLGIQGGADYTHQTMNSQAHPVTSPHALRYAHTRLYVASTLQYSDENWKLRFTLPLSYHLFRTDRQPDNPSGKHRRLFLPEPSLTGSYTLDAHWSINQSIHYRVHTPDITQLYAHYIVTGYREASKGGGFPQSKHTAPH